MLKKFFSKNNLIVFFNVLIIFLVFLIVINYQKSSFLYGHEYFWCYDLNSFINNVKSRIPPTIIYVLYWVFLPKILNININDYKTSVGAIFIAISYIYICYIFAKSFFIFSKENIPIIKEKIFILIYLISFLFMTFPVFYFKSNLITIHFMNIDETIRFFEFYFGYIFLLPIYFAIFNIVVKNKEYTKKDLVFLCLCSFLAASWNEIYNLSAFVTIFLSFIFYYVLNKKEQRNKALLYLFISFCIGFVCFYLIGDHFKGQTIASMNYNIYEAFSSNINNINLFIQKYIEYMFVNKIVFWLIFLFLTVIILKSKNSNVQKDRRKVIFISYSIIIGYLIACISEILVGNIYQEFNYIFQRGVDNNFQCNLFILVILILAGYIFYNSNVIKRIKLKKLSIAILFLKPRNVVNFLIILSLSAAILLSLIYIPKKYNSLIKDKKQTQIVAYNIEETMAIYSMFGESALLSDNIASNNFVKFGIVFTMQYKYQYRYKDDFKDFLRNKYLDGSYSLYRIYYNNQYINKFIGFQFIDNNKAYEEYKKRIKIIKNIFNKKDIYINKILLIMLQDKNKKDFYEIYKKRNYYNLLCSMCFDVPYNSEFISYMEEKNAEKNWTIPYEYNLLSFRNIKTEQDFYKYIKILMQVYQLKNDKKLYKDIKKRIKKYQYDDEIKFENIKEKFGDRRLTLKDIESIEPMPEMDDVLVKAKAYINYRDNNYYEALKLYNEYLSKYNPNDFDALINTAKIYKIQNNVKKVKEIYQKLIALDNNNIIFKYNYLNILYNFDKDYISALKLCDDMIQTEPKMAANYLNKGIVYHALKQNKQAKEMIELGKQKNGFQYEELLKNNNCNDINELLNEKQSMQLLEPKF